jgi:quercetin dioxygenase-like cupin family protein
MRCVEPIVSKDKPLAFIVRADMSPEATTFVTPPDFEQQVGFIVYAAGGEIRRHSHRPVERHITRTSEVVFVRSGRCEIDIYDDDRSLVATRELKPGDLVIAVAGGHGYRMLEDTVLLEVKQGPYTGIEERVPF